MHPRPSPWCRLSAATFDRRPNERRPVASSRARAFKLARRHTFLVRGLRIVCPLLALGCFSAYVIGVPLTFKIGNVNVSTSKTFVTGEKVRMENPRMQGFTKDSGRYDLTAKAATHEFAKPSLIGLEGIEARLTEANGDWSNVVAATGLFDREAKIIDLSGDVLVTNSGGLTANLLDAHVVIESHQVTTDKPVAVKSPNLEVRAQSMALDTKSKHVVFDRQVVTDLVPPAKPDEGTPAALPGYGFASDKPIHIQSSSLDVNDDTKIALFAGPVVTEQNQTVMLSDTLKVVYASPETAASAANGLGGGASLSEIFASGGISIVTPDGRSLKAANLHFVKAANLLNVTGGVTLADGANSLSGQTLIAELDRHIMRFPPGGRVKGHFNAAAAGSSARLPKGGAKVEQGKAGAASAFGGGFSGFASGGDGPTDIEANQLDYMELKGLAQFRGKVIAHRGANIISANSLDVVMRPGSGAAAGIGGDLVRLDAKGGVNLKGAEKRAASGDQLAYDAATDILIMSGHVVVTDGEQVVNGEKLTVDLKSGQSKLENGAGGQTPVAAAEAGSVPLLAATRKGCPDPTRPCLIFQTKDFEAKLKQRKKN